MRTVEAWVYNPDGTKTLYQGLVSGRSKSPGGDDQQVGTPSTEGDQQRVAAMLGAGGHPELKGELLAMAKQQKWSARRLEDVARKTMELIDKKQVAK